MSCTYIYPKINGVVDCVIDVETPLETVFQLVVTVSGCEAGQKAPIPIKTNKYKADGGIWLMLSGCAS